MLGAKIETLGVDPQNGSVVVLLRTENEKLLPIVIGPLEGHHIMVALQGEKPPRPLTPDLLLSVMEMLQARLNRVEIIDLKEGTFYARLILEHRGIELEVDARPSDAMALALRAKAPILVAEEVVERAGVEEASLKPQGAAEA
ncbi:bifunctional nuclease family protein [Thermus sediminis]|uniref:bifunctional nuclease family protein n=1 Tax=Thermus sediminis TaxID=1761908 RepID=UPI000E3B8B64|nr:bifunctional nuclease family protein [Thermus sediminis]